ncbi:hypothetical protein HPP92_009816 [Vanilla planifolia]|uniref:Uncharacterized protein n=1 Tax=Vanilla planifolia TaxID=51239 RepID=A0A835V973_VANPL|nr:hypothetical protein HPP92_009816 [Vanilla planifolia]
MDSGHAITKRSYDYHSDELQWVIQIRQSLQHEIEEEEENNLISIPAVPKPLQCGSLAAYIPQTIAIGPYHQLRAELNDMARCKLSAAKRIRQQLRGRKFQDIIDAFITTEHKIRAHYQRYINFNVETLAWIMAIDACFLLEFLQFYAFKNVNILQEVSPLISVRRSLHNGVLRDVLMLENQMPLFLLKRVMNFCCASSQEAEDMLSTMVMSFIMEVSPFKIAAETFQCIQKRSHLLEILYYFLVSPSEDPYLTDEKEGFSVLRQPFEYFMQGDKPKLGDAASSIHRNIDKLPLLDEIAIPSAKELVQAGVQFFPIEDQLSAIMFDKKTGNLHLPIINIDVNTEVLLRNLVAYETAVVNGPLVLTRYTELMNGIIDDAEDAKVLRQRGVIMNRLKSDAEVSHLWNGMARSVRTTKKQFLDKVIEDINMYHNCSWRVKAGRSI